ncbi:DNA-binding LytR/AlgR family response regulator [Actimicrobium sp. GrIS 1.19]|uniref:LytR/AlgR family response regulator transcription factor n=1 Tax=Actimicrobium sp. GrIS 1.19 TaxID=3071708 RepID=UPI002DFED61A|nr:DNA-binding LytR/AlgR family response regulator [Actimicrobium sp. GrIS 1.19]
MTALIAEDEPILAQMLVHALQRLWPELQIVAVVDNGVAAAQQALTLQPEILFLDIKMPGQSGLEVARELADEWPDGVAFPMLVFVTAYEEFAVQAFEHAAVDYLCKPINDVRLAKTIERLRVRARQPTRQLDDIVQQLRALVPAIAPAAARLTMLRAAVGNQVRMIPVAEVVYFEATDKYLRVVCANGESLIRLSLKELMPQLDPDQFWQIHRRTLVNAACIELAQRDDAGKLSVRLRGRPELLRVSRLFAHLFRQM